MHTGKDNNPKRKLGQKKLNDEFKEGETQKADKYIKKC